MKFRVFVGNELPVGSVEVLEARSRLGVARTRNIIALLATGAILISLGVAGFLGMMDRTFDELVGVWGAVGAPLGYIFGFYFRKETS